MLNIIIQFCKYSVRLSFLLSSSVGTAAHHTLQYPHNRQWFGPWTTVVRKIRPCELIGLKRYYHTISRRKRRQTWNERERLAGICRQHRRCLFERVCAVSCCWPCYCCCLCHRPGPLLSCLTHALHAMPAQQHTYRNFTYYWSYPNFSPLKWGKAKMRPCRKGKRRCHQLHNIPRYIVRVSTLHNNLHIAHVWLYCRCVCC